jgi:hypothetical protein
MVHSHSTGLLARIRHHREDVAAHHQLQRELASFSSPAERLELETIVARHQEEDRRQIEELMRAQSTERLFNRTSR